MLQALAMKFDGRVRVTRQNVALRRLDRMMRQNKGRLDQRSIDALNPQLFGRVARAFVVVAPDEHDLDILVQSAPTGDRLERAPALFGMNGISEQHEPAAVG